MDDFEAVEQSQWLANYTKGVIDLTTTESDRSRQAKANVLGVSDIGNCHEYVRRVILDEEPSQEVDTWNLAAFIGTAIGDHFESAFVKQDPAWHKQDEVTVRLNVRGYELEILGHPDLWRRSALIDCKTRDGLGVVRRVGSSDQERYQKALYAKALIDRGDMDENAWLHNVYIDRSGQDLEPHVVSERFSWDTVAEAVAWLDDVMYAVQMGEEAYRDPPREWCYACCPFAPQCRGVEDSDVQGKITDPFVIEAIKIHRETSEQIKALTKDKKSAESVLRGISGSTDDFTVRWVHVNGGPVAYERSGYDRLDVKPVRRKPNARRPVRNRADVRGAGEVPATTETAEVPSVAGVQGEADVV